MTTYSAITIGPILKTLLQAKRTREAWQASYFFSFVMQSIIEKAKQNGTIILPADKNAQNYFGAGIYPDRLIMTSDKSFDIQETVIEPALKKIEKSGIDQNPLQKYLNIHFIQVDENQLKTFDLKDDKGQPITSYIHKLNYLLDVKELNPNYCNSDVDFFKALFSDNVRKFLYSSAFGTKKHKFNSIFEITAQDNQYIQKEIEKLITNGQNSDIDNLLFIDENIEKNLEKHQKYIAILRADGDNFGKLISNISDQPAQVTKFSQDLVLFSGKASEIIHKFGGTIIYIGGDDILALCPVIKDDKNIFGIVNELNTEFHNVFKDNIYKVNRVSLSYGLSISYYKYPLNEALETSIELLFGKAKQEPLKNCIAFQVLQHSGSLRETILNFSNDNNFDSFNKMLADLKEKDQLLQSLTHQLIEDMNLLKVCLERNRLDEYFENHYNPADKRPEVKDFIEAMRDNLKANYSVLVQSDKQLTAEGKENLEDIAGLALRQMNTIAKAINFLK